MIYRILPHNNREFLNKNDLATTIEPFTLFLTHIFLSIYNE